VRARAQSRKLRRACPFLPIEADERGLR
jgi:hypothetical protein